MIFSGTAVHTKGLGLSLVSRRKRLIAAWRSTIEQKTPRLGRRLVSLAKKPSTALSQLAEVGVKWQPDLFGLRHSPPQPGPTGLPNGTYTTDIGVVRCMPDPQE